MVVDDNQNSLPRILVWTKQTFVLYAFHLIFQYNFVLFQIKRSDNAFTIE